MATAYDTDMTVTSVNSVFYSILLLSYSRFISRDHAILENCNLLIPEKALEGKITIDYIIVKHVIL